jgi:hypothetical protein
LGIEELGLGLGLQELGPRLGLQERCLGLGFQAFVLASASNSLALAKVSSAATDRSWRSTKLLVVASLSLRRRSSLSEWPLPSWP